MVPWSSYYEVSLYTHRVQCVKYLTNGAVHVRRDLLRSGRVGVGRGRREGWSHERSWQLNEVTVES